MIRKFVQGQDKWQHAQCYIGYNNHTTLLQRESAMLRQYKYPLSQTPSKTDSIIIQRAVDVTQLKETCIVTNLKWFRHSILQYKHSMISPARLEFAPLRKTQMRWSHHLFQCKRRSPAKSKNRSRRRESKPRTGLDTALFAKHQQKRLFSLL